MASNIVVTHPCLCDLCLKARDMELNNFRQKIKQAVLMAGMGATEEEKSKLFDILKLL